MRDVVKARKRSEQEAVDRVAAIWNTKRARADARKARDRKISDLQARSRMLQFKKNELQKELDSGKSKNNFEIQGAKKKIERYGQKLAEIKQAIEAAKSASK